MGCFDGSAAFNFLFLLAFVGLGRGDGSA